MGRKKIRIEKIADEKGRSVTFNKRKVGLMKKAIELSVLCDCEVAIMVFHENQLHQYSSQDVIDNTLRRYSYYDGPYECIRSTDLDDLRPGKASSFKVGTTMMKRRRVVPPGDILSAHPVQPRDSPDQAVPQLAKVIASAPAPGSLCATATTVDAAPIPPRRAQSGNDAAPAHRPHFDTVQESVNTGGAKKSNGSSVDTLSSSHQEFEHESSNHNQKHHKTQENELQRSLLKHTQQQALRQRQEQQQRQRQQQQQQQQQQLDEQLLPNHHDLSHQQRNQMRDQQQQMQEQMERQHMQQTTELQRQQEQQRQHQRRQQHSMQKADLRRQQQHKRCIEVQSSHPQLTSSAMAAAPASSASRAGRKDAQGLLAKRGQKRPLCVEIPAFGKNLPDIGSGNGGPYGTAGCSKISQESPYVNGMMLNSSHMWQQQSSDSLPSPPLQQFPTLMQHPNQALPSPPIYMQRSPHDPRTQWNQPVMLPMLSPLYPMGGLPSPSMQLPSTASASSTTLNTPTLSPFGIGSDGRPMSFAPSLANAAAMMHSSGRRIQ